MNFILPNKDLCKKVFETIDKDDSGYLDVYEILEVFK